MKEQLNSALRSALKVIGGALIARGLATDAMVEASIGGLFAIGGIAWSWWHHLPIKNITNPETKDEQKS